MHGKWVKFDPTPLLLCKFEPVVGYSYMKVVYICVTNGLKMWGLRSGPSLKMGGFRSGPALKKRGILELRITKKHIFLKGGSFGGPRRLKEWGLKDQPRPKNGELSTAHTHAAHIWESTPPSPGLNPSPKILDRSLHISFYLSTYRYPIKNHSSLYCL